MVCPVPSDQVVDAVPSGLTMYRPNISTRYIYPLRVASSTGAGVRFRLGWQARWAASRRGGARLQPTIRIPDEVGDQLRLIATVTGVAEEEHLRRAMRDYLETSGRHAELTALTDRARERFRAVLDRLGDL